MTGLAELQRRAYARDSTAEDRAAAGAALAALRPAAPDHDGFAVPVFDRPRVPRTLLAALLGSTAGLALVATVVATFVPPAAALDVFDRPATARDAAAPSWALGDGASDIHWLADEGEREFYAYRDASAGICLAIVSGVTGFRTCSPVDRFARDGMAITSYEREAMDRINRVSVRWLPSGELRVAVVGVTGQ